MYQENAGGNWAQWRRTEHNEGRLRHENTRTLIDVQASDNLLARWPIVTSYPGLLPRLYHAAVEVRLIGHCSTTIYSCRKHYQSTCTIPSHLPMIIVTSAAMSIVNQPSTFPGKIFEPLQAPCHSRFLSQLVHLKNRLDMWRHPLQVPKVSTLEATGFC